MVRNNSTTEKLWLEFLTISKVPINLTAKFDSQKSSAKKFSFEILCN